MQLSSKLLFRTAIVLVGVMLTMLVFVAVINSQQANATTPSQWEKLRGYINEYYGGPQSGGGLLNSEAGFRMGKVALWDRLDSNHNIAPNAGAGVGLDGTTLPTTAVTGVLGEGDDMTNRPVLTDNLMGQKSVIPGTEFRCSWNANNSCFSSASIATLRGIVDKHKAAGFSTDIVDYCVSSQTAGPTTGGFGIIAQVPGALSSDPTLTPNVYIADYSRNGWRNSLSNAPGANAVAVPEASAGGFAAPGTPAGTVAPPACDTAATDLDLVLCSANWAITKATEGGGEVGNGQMTIATIAAAGQTVDVRSGTVNTVASGGSNIQQPISTLFSAAGLANLNPLATTIVASRTQMGATSAIGLKMLGYPMVAGGSIANGMPRWNSSEGEQQAAYGDGLPLQPIAAFTAPGPVDTTAPTSASVTVSNVDTSSADIERTASEPATMKVELSTTGPGGPFTEVANDRVLNAVKDLAVGNGNATHLTGLASGTTYDYRVTSYDGYANGIVTTGSFATSVACTAAKPSLSLSAPAPLWASYADYTARLLTINWTINNTGTNGATNVAITGSTNTNGVTLNTALPASVGSIGAGSSAVVTLKYNVPLTTGSWRTSTTASAGDDCGGTGYTYP